ncbi:MAG: hypothetical protein U0Q12_01120 [Vicinamibacterales bacterium]
MPDLLRFLKVVGLSGFEKTAAHYGLGLTLGNAEVRLTVLAAAYAAIARGGEWLAPTFSRATVDVSQERRRVMSPRTAFWITDIPSDASAREYVFGRGSSLEFPFPVAVKNSARPRPTTTTGRPVIRATSPSASGWQFRSHTAPRFIGCHRCRTDLPRRHARGRAAVGE